MEVALRPARLEDIPALIDLFAAVASERMWIGTEPGFDRERVRAGYARTLADPDHLTLVAEVEAAIIASLRLVPRGDGHHLGMFIDANQRGRQIGTNLMAAAIAWARGRKTARIELGVFPHNAAALRLYEKSGFCIVERRIAAAERQTGDVWDVIEMELRL